MLPGQREAVILNFVEQNGIVTVSQICSHCGCSPQTARRDLQRLEDRGLLIRTHGGATSPTNRISTVRPVISNALLEARTALVDRADVLIVTPSETTATRRLVEQARRAGVPIIAESHNYPGATSLVAINDYQAGLELGYWVSGYARRHMDSRVVVLDVTSLLSNTAARSRGFTDGLGTLPPGARKIYRVLGQNVREEARKVVAEALAVHPDINVIFGINDDSALGALDAYRLAGLDESRLLVVSFGLEGTAAKDALMEGGPFKASVAMFPELVGRLCLDAAVCAYHGHSLPERLFTPFAIVTAENLSQFYQPEEKPRRWTPNWPRVAQLRQTNPELAQINDCQHNSRPRTVGFVQIFSSHEWYQNLGQAMQAHARSLGISLEVVDVSQDSMQEIDRLKQTIGSFAANYVHEGDTIILDAGDTTCYLAHALKGRQSITVITNSLAVMAELEGEKDITLVSSGGVVRNESRCLTGPGAEAAFQELRADKAFISATGLSLAFGMSNMNIAEATVKRAMLGASREVILLADHTKIGVESLVKIAPLDAINRLIVDSGISSHDRLAFIQRGIDVVIAEV